MSMRIRCARPLLVALWLLAPLAAQSAELTPLQVVRDGAAGLSGAWAIAVSPDGQNAYVANRLENSLAIFVRDFGVDRFRYIGILVDGVDGVDGLQGASAVAVSPNGLYVYVTGLSENALAVFERSASTGLLTFLGALRDGDPGVDGLATPTGVAVAASGRVFVSSYGDNGLSAFDPGFPTLSPVGVWKNGDPGVSGMGGATGVVVAGGYYGDTVYVSSQFESAVAVFSTNFPSQFSQTQVVQNGVDGFAGLGLAQGLAMSPNGQHLYVAGAGDSAVAVLDRDTNSGHLTMNSIAKSGVAGVTGLDSVNTVCAEPGGNSVYAGGGQSGAFFSFTPGVVTLGVDPFDFGLDFVQFAPLPSFLGLALEQVAVASLPDSSKILVTDSFNGLLTIFDRDVSTGALATRQTIPNGAGVIGVAGAQVVVASRDGQNVYVLGDDEAVVTELARDSTSGTLSFVGVQRSSGYLLPINPRYRNATMSPDGKNLYVFDYRMRRITVFRRDVIPGRLFPAQAVVSNTAAVPAYLQFDSGAVSPDGTRLFALSPLQDSISIFARDPATGELTHLATHSESEFGLGMLGPQALIAGPNGAVYVGGSANVHMPIQLNFGSAGDYLGGTTTGLIPGQQLCGGISLAFDSTYTHLVTGQYGNSVCVLARNPVGGGLSYIGFASVPGKSGPVDSVATSPNGRRVYATLYDGIHPNVGHSALAAFSLDPATGALALLESVSDQTPGVGATQGLISVAVSPDGRQVYGAAYLDDAVVAFAPEPAAPALGIAALVALGAAASAARGRVTG